MAESSEVDKFVAAKVAANPALTQIRRLKTNLTAWEGILLSANGSGADLVSLRAHYNAAAAEVDRVLGDYIETIRPGTYDHSANWG